SRQPRFRPVLPHLHGRVHRLHRYVRQEWQLEDRLDDPAGVIQYRRYVALLPHHSTRFTCVRVQLRQNGAGAEARMPTPGPLDPQATAAFEGGPRVLCDDGHATSSKGVGAYRLDGEYGTNTTHE